MVHDTPNKQTRAGSTNLVTCKYKTARDCAVYTKLQSITKVTRTLEHPLADNALAPASKRRYDSAIRLFERFLLTSDTNLVNEDTLVDFYHYMYTIGYAYSTAATTNSAIADYVKNNGIRDITQSRRVQCTLEGYKKLDAPTRMKFQREALTLEGFNSLIKFTHNKGYDDYCILFSLAFFLFVKNQ